MRRLFLVLLVGLLAVTALGAASVSVASSRGSSSAQGDYDDYGDDSGHHDDEDACPSNGHGDGCDDATKDDDSVHGGHGKDDAMTTRPTSPAASPEASPMASPAATPAANRVDVAIVNFAFNPETITIKPGTTVVWTNTSPTQHTIFAKWAESDILEQGDTFEWTFTQEGTYDYICGLHPNMKGTIIVDKSAP